MLQKQAFFGNLGSAAISGIKNLGSSGLQVARNTGSTLANKLSGGLQNLGSKVSARAQQGRLNTVHIMADKYNSVVNDTYKQLRTSPKWAAVHGGNEQVIRDMAQEAGTNIVNNMGKPRFGAWNFVDRLGTGITNIGTKLGDFGLGLQGVRHV